MSDLLSPRLSGLQSCLAELAAHRTRLASTRQAAGVEAQAQALARAPRSGSDTDGVHAAAETVNELGRTVGALTRAIDRSSRNGTLLVPWDAAGRGRPELGFWQPALDPHAPQLEGLRRIADSCRIEGRQLPGLVNIIQQQHGLQLSQNHVTQRVVGATRTVDRVLTARGGPGAADFSPTWVYSAAVTS